MGLERLPGDCNEGKACPTFHRAANGGIVAQGHVVTDPGILAALDLPPGEAAVSIPASLLPEVLPDAPH